MTREILRLPSKLRNQTAAGILHKASLFHVRRRHTPYNFATSEFAAVRVRVLQPESLRTAFLRKHAYYIEKKNSMFY